ncbi:MAG: hypothetical protein L6Q37_06190 [Bdellovibrionaceae bacterium]|nr:hypothetical protein [Pseudobdellovibrionaceae bacterium]
MIKKKSFSSTKKTIWIHAASGEIEYALPIIYLIKEQLPVYNILVTLSSPSMLSTIKNNILIDAYGPAPLDFPANVINFIKSWNPEKVLFARTDVWPELSYQLKKQKIPSYLFSCTLAQNSSRTRTLSQIFTRLALNQLNEIFVVTQEDKWQLLKIKVTTPIEVYGDSRFDQMDLKKKVKIELKNLFPQSSNQEEQTYNNNELISKKLLVAGSTWPEDEVVLLKAMNHLPNWRWIIAPHEVNSERIEKLKFLLEKHFPKMELQIYSTFNEKRKWDIIIVDQIGKLFSLYEFADACLVGGSFKEKVHSVMEPLSYNKYVLVGPNIYNNREAIEFSKINLTEKVKMVQVVQNEHKMTEVLSQIEKVTTEDRIKDFFKIQETFNSKKSASHKIFAAIFKTI